MKTRTITHFDSHFEITEGGKTRSITKTELLNLHDTPEWYDAVNVEIENARKNLEAKPLRHNFSFFIGGFNITLWDKKWHNNFMHNVEGLFLIGEALKGRTVSLYGCDTERHINRTPEVENTTITAYRVERDDIYKYVLVLVLDGVKKEFRLPGADAGILECKGDAVMNGTATRVIQLED